MGRGVGLTRERVLELAARVADEEGAHALTLTRLAELAGVQKPSLYRHVDGLPDVEAALTLRAYTFMADALADAGRHPDPVEAIRRVARAWRAGARAHPGQYALATRTHLRGEPAVFEAGARLVGAVLERMRALGLDGAEAVHAARSFRSLVHGFVTLEAGDGFGLDVGVDASFEAAVDALVRGWLSRSG